MVELTPDCQNCAALCCVALAFDKGEMFAFDKAAGEACRHLGEDHRCRIHNDLESKGMKGCTLYGCDGAGQRVVQDVFQGGSWRGQPALQARMMDAFSAMRAVHQQAGLLEAAKQLPLGAVHIAELARLQKILRLSGYWSEDELLHFQTSGILQEFEAFFTSLRAMAPQG